ncbi:MAG: alpha/beta fold hydrolase [Parerythrobacter sp.]
MAQQDPFIDGLIRDAYAVIGQPERLFDLLAHADHAMLEDNAGALGPTAETHFDQAGGLMDQTTPLVGSDWTAFEGGAKRNVTHALVLGADMSVVAFDRSEFSGPDLATGRSAPDWLWDPSEKNADIARIKRCSPETGSDFLRLFATPDDDQGSWYALTCEDGAKGRQTMFASIQFRWNEASGDRFGAALGLTLTELALTRHLVTGGTLRSFSEQRGRSIGTVRNQMKTLCRKLSIGSQQELLILYTGFAHSLQQSGSAAGDGQHDCFRVHCAEDGSAIAWEEHGDPDGKPVLYFHTFFEGALLTSVQDAAAKAAGLRIIAPWRPYWGETSGHGEGFDLVYDFADRLQVLLDRLGIDKCALLGATAGAPFALGAAQRFGARAAGLVLAGPVLPYRTWAELNRLAPGYRRPMKLARLAPAFARMWIRATVGGTLLGDFDAIADDFLGEASADRQHLKHPDARATIKRAGSYTFRSSLEGPVQAVLLEISDWNPLCTDIEAPVTVMVGDKPGGIDRTLFEEFAARHKFALADDFTNSSQFVLHDDPARVFSTLHDMAA